MLSASCSFVWVIEPVLCMSNGVIPHQGMGRMDVFFKGCGGWMCFSKDGEDGCVFQGMTRMDVFFKGWPMTCKKKYLDGLQGFAANLLHDLH